MECQGQYLGSLPEVAVHDAPVLGVGNVLQEATLELREVHVLLQVANVTASVTVSMCSPCIFLAELTGPCTSQTDELP